MFNSKSRAEYPVTQPSTPFKNLDDADISVGIVVNIVSGKPLF
jgi:hypothetical protein